MSDHGRRETRSIIEDLLKGGWLRHGAIAQLYVHPDDPALTLWHDVEDDNLIPSGKLMAIFRSIN